MVPVGDGRRVRDLERDAAVRVAAIFRTTFAVAGPGHDHGYLAVGCSEIYVVGVVAVHVPLFLASIVTLYVTHILSLGLLVPETAIALIHRDEVADARRLVDMISIAAVSSEIAARLVPSLTRT